MGHFDLPKSSVIIQEMNEGGCDEDEESDPEPDFLVKYPHGVRYYVSKHAEKRWYERVPMCLFTHIPRTSTKNLITRIVNMGEVLGEEMKHRFIYYNGLFFPCRRWGSAYNIKTVYYVSGINEARAIISRTLATIRERGEELAKMNQETALQFLANLQKSLIDRERFLKRDDQSPSGIRELQRQFVTWQRKTRKLIQQGYQVPPELLNQLFE